MSAQHHHIDHSTTLQKRLLQLVNTDTADVTFVVGPGVDSYNGHLMSKSNGRVMAGMPVGKGGHTVPADESTSKLSSYKKSAVTTTTTATTPSAGRALQANSSNYHNNNGGSSSDMASTECSHSRADERPTGQTGRGVGEDARVNAVGIVPLNNHDQDSHASVGEVGEFRCHRVMFAACSDYFKALLYGGMSETQTRRVEFRDVSPKAFETILIYAYTGRVVVTAGVFVSILPCIIAHS